jgi:hypothetical protein
VTFRIFNAFHHFLTVLFFLPKASLQRILEGAGFADLVRLENVESLVLVFLHNINIVELLRQLFSNSLNR